MRRPTDQYAAYEHWRRVLAGERVPIHLDTPPQLGWYRLRTVRGGPWLGVVIWLDQQIDAETGELISDEIIRARLAGEDVPPARVWPHCAHRAITPEECANLDSAAIAPLEEAAFTPTGRVDPLQFPMRF
jgi:hypothetical protein